MKQYTVMNKDIARLEKVRRRPLPWLRRIKLFIQKGSMTYFPVGLFPNNLNEGNDLSFKLTFNGEYRKEQKWIIDNIWKTWLIVMKTGKWKTNCCLGIIEKYQKKTLIAVHSITTLHQMVESFKTFAWIDIWVYYGAKKRAWEIMVTTHDSLTEKYDEIKKMNDFSMLIVDEADRNVTPKMLEAVIMSDPQYFYGMTWTPRRADLHEQDLEMIYGKMIVMPEQDNNGYMMIPNIKRVISYDNRFFSFENRHDLWEQMSTDSIRTNKQCNFVIDLRRQNKFKYWLMLMLRRESESELYYRILKESLPCYLMHGKTKRKDDVNNMEEFKKTWWIIIWTSGKLGRWLDIPYLDTLFLFYPNRFQSDTIQSVWRILRLDDSKTQATVYDWCDLPILKWQANERMSTYKTEYWDNVKIDTIYLDEPSI